MMDMQIRRAGLRKASLKIIVIVLVLALSFLLTACDEKTPREDVFSYVNANVKLLETFPYDELKKA